MRACARQDLAPAKKQVQVSKGNVMPCVRPSYNLPHQAVQAVERDLPHFACILISWLPHCIRIAPHFFDERLARRSCAAGCIIPPPLLFKKMNGLCANVWRQLVVSEKLRTVHFWDQLRRSSLFIFILWMITITWEKLARYLDELAIVFFRHVVIKAPQAASKFVRPFLGPERPVSIMRWVWQLVNVKEPAELFPAFQQEL